MLKIITSVVLTLLVTFGGAFGIYKHQNLLVLTQEDQAAIELAFLMQGMGAYQAGEASCKKGSL